MRHESEIKELLIENAIHLIAEGGFEKATTKELTHSGGNLPDFKMNEVYIYRFFKSKENLYKAAFLRLDSELFYAFKHGVEIVGGFNDCRKEKLERFFSLAWQFILGNEERCRCYVRYYYSIYFRGASLEAHRKLFAEMVDVMTPIFKEKADVIAVIVCRFVCLSFFVCKNI